MASQELIESLIEYYVNLLIIQYHDLPKASATIALLADAVIADGITFDVQDAYNLVNLPGDAWDSGEIWDGGETWDSGDNGTAIGKQLDVIGKYVGVNRYYTAINLANYFAMVTASQAASLPSSPPAFGFSTAATFGNYDYNGTLVTNNIITSQNALSDSDFLTLIRFMILCNNMNYSAAAIDNALWVTFGAQVRAESGGNMTMVYFFTGAISTLLNTIIFKNLLPAPEGVGVRKVNDIAGQMFAFVSCAQIAQGVYSPFGYGFSTASNYATLSGQVLTCSQIS